MRGTTKTLVWRQTLRPIFFAALISSGMFAISACALGTPSMGEGPPPGYIGGDIPERYRGQKDPFGLADGLALEAGRLIYDENCSLCHGAKGRGDGPRAPYLEPAPADFAAQPMLKAFREHHDYVFWWVSEGVTQTPMPAFGDSLGEAERWQVITYAWYLGEQAAKQ